MTTETTTETESVDAAATATFDRLFGLSHEPEDGEDAPAAETTAAPAKTQQQAATDEEEATEDPEAEPPVRGISELLKVAQKQSAKREQKDASASKIRELESAIAELRAGPKATAADLEAAAAFRRMQQMGREQPIELLDALGIDVVSFLQNGHRQALDRQGHTTERTLQQMAAQLKAAQDKIAELEAGVPKQLEDRELKAQQQANQREFFAITSNTESYPLLSSEDYGAQLELATRAAAALAKAGYTDITHKLVADTAEKELRDEYERRSAALGRGAPGKSPNTPAAQASGSPTAMGRSRTGRTGAATLTNTMAAEGTNDRDLTPRERDASDRRMISKIFGVPER